MKKVVVSLLISLLLLSCSETTSPENSSDKLVTSIDMFDTGSVKTNTVKEGEKFILKFTIVNQTERDIKHRHIVTPFLISILKDGTPVRHQECLSIIGIRPVSVLKKGELLVNSWVAPEGAGCVDNDPLPPGHYTAIVDTLGVFVDYPAPVIKPLEFTVVE